MAVAAAAGAAGLEIVAADLKPVRLFLELRRGGRAGAARGAGRVWAPHPPVLGRSSAPRRPRGAGSGAGAAAALPSRRSSAVGAGLSRRGTLSPGAAGETHFTDGPWPLSAAPRRRPVRGRERSMDGTVSAALSPRPGRPQARPCPGHLRDAHAGATPGPGTDSGQRRCCSRPGAARGARPAGSPVESGRTPRAAGTVRPCLLPPPLLPRGLGFTAVSQRGPRVLRRAPAALLPCRNSARSERQPERGSPVLIYGF